MDALADGVEARLNLIVGHSQIVCQRTIEIARQLGLPEKEIQRWAAERPRAESWRSMVSSSSPGKVRRSLFAESIMRATELVMSEPTIIKFQEEGEKGIWQNL